MVDSIRRCIDEQLDDQWTALVYTYPLQDRIVVHLLFGFSRRGDGISAYTATLGGEGLDVDLVNGDEYDVVDSTRWEQFVNKVRSLHGAGRLAGGVTGPPCDTLSAARGFAGGPQPLRTESGPGRYGRRDLDQPEAERVKIGTLHAMRALEFCRMLREWGLPFFLENPAPRSGHPSMFNLDEFVEFSALAGVLVLEGPQCPAGSPYAKRTRWLTNCSLDALPACTHDEVDWIVPATGERYKGPHMRLAGKAPAIRLSDHYSGIFPNASDAFVSKAAAAYPSRINRWIVSAIATCPLPSLPVVVAAASSTSPRANTIERQTHVIMSAPLKGHRADTSRGALNRLAIGGMRRPLQSIQKIPGHADTGRLVARALEDFLDKHPWLVPHCVKAVDANNGATNEERDVPCSTVADVRCLLQRTLTGHDAIDTTDPKLTELYYPLWRDWAARAKDPDHPFVRWLRQGAPAGISAQPESVGIFPPSDKTAEDERELSYYYDGFCNTSPWMQTPTRNQR